MVAQADQRMESLDVAMGDRFNVTPAQAGPRIGQIAFRSASMSTRTWEREVTTSASRSRFRRSSLVDPLRSSTLASLTNNASYDCHPPMSSSAN